MKRRRDFTARAEALHQKILDLLSRAASIPTLADGHQWAELHEIQRVLQELERQRDVLRLEHEHAQLSNHVSVPGDAVGIDPMLEELCVLNDSTSFNGLWAGGQ
jgi:hypothetical protein